ncbi:MAG: Fur family transcriptional regulator [Dehalococcoidia bacterium]
MTNGVALGKVVKNLEERGYRVTSPRLAVLAAVADAGDLFSADEVAHRLPRVGRATIFRTLKLLVALDVLCRVLLDDGSLRYRWSRHGHHHHLVCNDCGAVQDFTACDVAELVKELTLRANFTVEGHWLEVYGRCSACAAEKLATPVEVASG